MKQRHGGIAKQTPAAIALRAERRRQRQLDKVSVVGGGILAQAEDKRARKAARRLGLVALEAGGQAAARRALRPDRTWNGR